MATLREYFDVDFNRAGQWFTDLTMTSPTESVTAKFRVHCDFDSGAKYISCFLPHVREPERFLLSLFRDYPQYLRQSENVEMATVHLPGGRMLSSRVLHFTGRLIVYYDDQVSPEIESLLYDESAKLDLLFELRTSSWAARRQSFEHPLAFICHDSRDKDDIARPLAIELAKLACPVWFDEFSLQLGDSLRESIEKGLKEAKKCILVITPSFLANERWTKREFESIFTREVLMNEKIVLPIWHNVTPEQVYQYSPSLVNKFARQWSKGKEVLAHEIRRLVLAA